MMQHVRPEAQEFSSSCDSTETMEHDVKMMYQLIKGNMPLINEARVPIVILTYSWRSFN